MYYTLHITYQPSKGMIKKLIYKVTLKFNYLFIKFSLYKIIDKILLGRFSTTSYISRPSMLVNPINIEIGKNVFIRKDNRMDSNEGGKIIIEDEVFIEDMVHISAINEVSIGYGSLIGSKVHITDHNHTIDQSNKPLKFIPVKSKGTTKIGNNCWVGDNVVIISAHIGEHSIIGANSLVNKDIPPFSVAVGAPAKVVKNLK